MSECQSFDPVADTDSRLLILGSMPGIRSLQMQQYYGHPQNRFWKVLANVFQAEVPGTIEEKKAFLLEHRIAVWDVIGQCEITGSSDSSIRYDRWHLQFHGTRYLYRRSYDNSCTG